MPGRVKYLAPRVVPLGFSLEFRFNSVGSIQFRFGLSIRSIASNDRFNLPFIAFSIILCQLHLFHRIWHTFNHHPLKEADCLMTRNHVYAQWLTRTQLISDYFHIVVFHLIIANRIITQEGSL